MSVKTVARQEFEQSPGPLLDFVASGNEVIIVENDTVRARLVSAPTAPPPKAPRVPGRHAGEVWIADDFDEPLPDSFWLGDEE